MATQAPGGQLVITDGFTFKEHARLRLLEFIRVVRLALVLPTAKIGHDWIMDEALEFPAMFVEFDEDRSIVDTMGGPTDLMLAGEALLYLTGDDREDLKRDAVRAVDALRKLFSPNALDDIETEQPTHRWMANDSQLGDAPTTPAWYEITTGFRIARAMQFRQTQGQKLLRVVRIQLTMKAYAIL